MEIDHGTSCKGKSKDKQIGMDYNILKYIGFLFFIFLLMYLYDLNKECIRRQQFYALISSIFLTS